jgi:hypothetical protein
MQTLPTFTPSDYQKPVRYSKGRTDKIDQQQLKVAMLRDLYKTHTVPEIARKTNISIGRIRYLLEKYGIRDKKHIRHEQNELIGLALEEFFGNGLSQAQIHLKLKVWPSTLSAYIRKMFPVRMTENTEVIVLKSKAWKYVG